MNVGIKMTEFSLGFGRRKLIEQIVIQNWNIDHPEKKVFSFNELLFVIQEMISEEGKTYFEGKSINRGFQIFRDFAKYILYRNLANFDTMLLFTGQKGCLDENTEIFIKKNNKKIKIKLKDILDKIINLYSYDFENNKIKLSKGKIFNTGKKEVYEIEFNNGEKILATKNHKFFINNNGKIIEKKLKNIREDDELVFIK